MRVRMDNLVKMEVEEPDEESTTENQSIAGRGTEENVVETSVESEPACVCPSCDQQKDEDKTLTAEASSSGSVSSESVGSTAVCSNVNASSTPNLDSAAEKVEFVTPGTKDSEGFLAPPPASTLLIRRSRVGNTGATTYVITPTNKTQEEDIEEMDTNSWDSVPNPALLSHGKPMGMSGKQVKRRPGRPVGSVGKYKKRSNSSDENTEVRTSSRVRHDGDTDDSPWIYPSSFRSPAISLGKPPMAGYQSSSSYSKSQKKYRAVNIDPLTGKRKYTRRKKFGVEKKHHKEDVELPEQNKQKQHLSDNGIWRPTDDLRLIVNTLATGDLESVYLGVKFSCYFTFKEIEERWRKLMYGEKSSLVSQNAINVLHPYVKARIHYESLFGPEEEKLIATVKMIPNSNPDVKSFQALLDENPHVFNKYRTARSLMIHWLDMRDFQLLPYQNPQNFKPSEHFECFENLYNCDFDEDEEIEESNDMVIEQEVQEEDRCLKKNIRILEDEVSAWQLLTDQILDDGMKDRTMPPLPMEFDNKTYAVLRGKEVHYGMASREIVLGRSTVESKVDANLIEEGSGSKISKKQAVIRLKDMGRFIIINKGKLPIFVDKKAVPYRCAARLDDQSVIQIGTVSLVFFINELLIGKIVEQDIRREIYASFKDLEKDMPPLPPKFDSVIANRMGNNTSLLKSPYTRGNPEAQITTLHSYNTSSPQVVINPAPLFSKKEIHIASTSNPILFETNNSKVFAETSSVGPFITSVTSLVETQPEV